MVAPPTDSRTGPIDTHVGRQLRAARERVGWSQSGLGRQLGKSYQQVQKYEHGRNRISSSALYEFACIFGVPVSYFFDGLPEPSTTNTVRSSSLAARQVTHAGSRRRRAPGNLAR
jgi:transcriptional regulator with XRE-family HTH domain